MSISNEAVIMIENTYICQLRYVKTFNVVIVFCTY